MIYIPDKSDIVLIVKIPLVGQRIFKSVSFEKKNVTMGNKSIDIVVM